MRAWAALLMIALVLVGCNGMTKPSFEEVPPERLPDQLAAWRDAPADEVAIEDAVIGKDTYIRIVVGPCPSGRLQVTDLRAAGPNLSIVTAAPSRGQSNAYSVLYLKTQWEARTQGGPEHITLQVNQWTGTFAGFEGSGFGRGVLPAQQAVRYKPAYVETFRCNP